MAQKHSQYPLVVIVDSNEADREATRNLLIESGLVHVAGAVGEIPELSRYLPADPDIVLLDVGTVSAEVPALIRHVRDMAPRCDVVLTVGAGLRFDIAEALLAGMRGVVPKPVVHAQIMTAIYQVFEAEQARRRHFEDHKIAEKERGGEIITLYSPKGGVGCTTIATSLALALQKETHARVALVDLDLQFGDVDVLLDLHSSHNIHELMRSADDLDGSILDAVMVKHESGLSVLLPPPNLELVDQLAPEGLIAVLKALRKMYDYVVVDTWHAIEDITLAVIDLSNVLILVTTPEIPAVRDTKRMVELLHKRQGHKGNVQVVVNRYPSRSAIGLDQIERSLAIKPVATIPSDGHMITTAINEGVSFMSRPSEAASNLIQLANFVAQPRLAKTARDTGPLKAKKRTLPMFKRQAAT